jgi:hypothetical protein
MVRSGGSRHGSQGWSEMSRAETQMKESTGLASDHQVQIHASTKCTQQDYFYRNTSLTDIVFASDYHLKEIDGFYQCTSLPRIERPCSVEIIHDNGFCGCTSLNALDAEIQAERTSFSLGLN